MPDHIQTTGTNRAGRTQQCHATCRIQAVLLPLPGHSAHNTAQHSVTAARLSGKPGFLARQSPRQRRRIPASTGQSLCPDSRFCQNPPPDPAAKARFSQEITP
jgi:hypothetical protein